jgi:hypothetical protein
VTDCLTGEGKIDLTGGGRHISDSALEILINKAPQRSILYLEEVDTLFLSKEEKKKEKEGGGRKFTSTPTVACDFWETFRLLVIEGSEMKMRRRRMMTDDSDDDDGKPEEGTPPDPGKPSLPSMSKPQLKATGDLLGGMLTALGKEDSAVPKRLEAVTKLLKGKYTYTYTRNHSRTRQAPDCLGYRLTDCGVIHQAPDCLEDLPDRLWCDFATQTLIRTRQQRKAFQRASPVLLVL